MDDFGGRDYFRERSNPNPPFPEAHRGNEESCTEDDREEGSEARDREEGGEARNGQARNGEARNGQAHDREARDGEEDGPSSCGEEGRREAYGEEGCSSHGEEGGRKEVGKHRTGSRCGGPAEAEPVPRFFSDSVPVRRDRCKG